MDIGIIYLDHGIKKSMIKQAFTGSPSLKSLELNSNCRLINVFDLSELKYHEEKLWDKSHINLGWCAYEGLLVHMHAARNSLVGWNIHLYWGTSPGDSSIKVVSNVEFSKTIASPLGVACLRLAEFI